MSQEENTILVCGVDGICLENEAKVEAVDNGSNLADMSNVDVAGSENLTPPTLDSPEEKVGVEDDSKGGVKDKEEDEASDSGSDSEDDLQLIVNDEDIYFPHGTEGAEEGEGEEMYAAAPGEEHYDDMEWMHSYHSQFYKYVRPGTGAATTSPGVPDGNGQFTPGSMNGYPVGMWGYPFESYEFMLPPSQTIFDIDVEQFEDKPWDYPGVDVTDYFNFGFTEETWKQYCEEFAKAKEAYLATKGRDFEDGQEWNSENGEFEPVRGRGQGHRRNMRSIQVEGGSSERRDMRRQRLQDGRSYDHQGDRRRQRNDDMPRRKGFSRQDQVSPLGGRLGRTQSSPVRTFSSPSRDRRYGSRSRFPSPGSDQNTANGFRRHSMDASSRPWQRSSRRHDYDDESYRSSESDRHESEEELSRNHRMRRFSTQPLEKRLGARAEPPPSEIKSAPEKRIVRLPRYSTQEDEKKTELPKRLPPKIERSPGSTGAAAEKRLSSELVTEKRVIQTTRRAGQSIAEARTSEVFSERRPTLEKRASESRTTTEAVVEKNAEPVPVKKMQSISERRAQYIAERKAEQLIAEKREKLLAEKREKVIAEKREKLAERREQASEARQEAERVKAPVRMVEKPTKVASDQPASRLDTGLAKEKLGQLQKKDDRHRMQVIESVCSRWKFHIRRGDTLAKKKKQGDTEGAGNEDTGAERVDDGAVETRANQAKERRYRERQSDEKGFKDGADFDRSTDERWQTDRQERRRRQMDDLDARDEGSMSARRSSMRYAGTKRRYDDANGLVEAWAVDEEEYDGSGDNGRWNNHELEQDGYSTKRRRRRYDYNFVKEEQYADTEMEDAYNYDDLEDTRARLYGGSTSSGQGDEGYYRRRGKSYSRNTDRWTGSLYDSGGEYEER